nr:MAG: hypothetical protein EHM41_22680 [Chloroflexota bacterium]
MIEEYNRPETLEEALKLLTRETPVTVPLAGGSAIKRLVGGTVAVVDLQSLGLDILEKRGQFLEIGAMVTLQELTASDDVLPVLRDVIYLEASRNLRQAATVAGTLVSANGRSPFTTAMLALDALLFLQPGDNRQIGLGDLLPGRPQNLRRSLITQVRLPLNVSLAYEYVARTPADKPVVCAAAARWPSGRTRLSLGGFGPAPVLALDGPEAGGIVEAARDAYSNAGDEWASAAYRQEIAGVLAKRCIEKLS